MLQALLDETSTRIDIIVCELLLDLGQAQSIGDQFVGVHPHLIFAGGAAETGYINNVGYGFEILLDYPVFEDFSSMGSYFGLVLCR